MPKSKSKKKLAEQRAARAPRGVKNTQGAIDQIERIEDRLSVVLPQEIASAHRVFIANQWSSLESAAHAGELLSEVKSLVPHGSFEAWIKTNCEFSVQTAYFYRKINDRWPDLLEQRKLGNVKSLTEAYEFLGLSSNRSKKPALTAPQINYSRMLTQFVEGSVPLKGKEKTGLQQYVDERLSELNTELEQLQKAKEKLASAGGKKTNSQPKK